VSKQDFNETSVPGSQLDETGAYNINSFSVKVLYFTYLH